MKHKVSLAVAFGLLAAILAVILQGVIGSRQPDIPAPRALCLQEGEYSVDGGETWLPLEDRADMRKNRNDLILRGKADGEIGEGQMLNVCLSHMGLSVRINGEKIYSFAEDGGHVPPEACADQWVSVPLPALSAEDEITLQLMALHLMGLEGNRCERLVQNLYIGEPLLMSQWYEEQKLPERLLGQLLLVVGVTLLGISLAAAIMKSPLYRILFYTALLAIGEGAQWVYGAYAIVNYIGGSVAFCSLVISLSRVLVTFALMAGVSQLLLRHSTRASYWAACIQGAVSVGFILFAAVSGSTFCSLEMIWSIVQAPFAVVMLALCIPEVQEKKYTLRHRFFILAHMLSFGAILVALADRLLGWGFGVNVEKIVCGVMALCYASALFFQTPASHQAIQSAKKLSEELHQSRIVLAMSQIRTHFIFNVLNAISSLCKSDPDQADVELVRFSRYLRTNIDIMQEDKLISFEQEMDHVLNYVDLEQLRFDDRITVEEDYEVADFMLPSLIVQPLVENAIKHGLLPKKEGGEIRLSTRRRGNDVIVEIADNGVGFQAKKNSTHNSVGLSNVRFRVEKMAGGRLEIESKPGEGTVARVILPYQKEAEV